MFGNGVPIGMISIAVNRRPTLRVLIVEYIPFCAVGVGIAMIGIVVFPIEAIITPNSAMTDMVFVLH